MRLWITECFFVAIGLFVLIVLGYVSGVLSVFLYAVAGLVACAYLAQLFLITRFFDLDHQSRFERLIFSPSARHLLKRLQTSRTSIDRLEVRIEELEIRAKTRKEKMVSAARGFRDSLSALPDSLVALDQNNRIEWWNLAAENTLGLSSSDEGKRIEVIIGVEQFQKYASRTLMEDPIEFSSPTSTDVLLSARITPFGNRQRILHARDITRVRQLEKVRQDFVANASHELRTPLTVVHGYLESLMDNKIDEATPLPSLLNRMYQQTTRIKGIVEDMLTLSRLEQEPGPDAQAVDMAQLLDGARQEAEILSGEKRHEITLQAESGYVLQSNPEDIRSLISNLTSNAIRYTAPQGKIVLNWRVEREGAFFSVTDTGIGIEPEHISRITERFYRVDVARSRDSGGTGLGLAIVKHVLVRMGGDLSITSKSGIGSTFTCFFPIDLVHRNAA